MALNIIVFIFYFLLFNLLITRIRFFKEADINKYWLVALFSIKIFAGVAYGLFYMQPEYLGSKSDTWAFYDVSLKETDWLLKDPAAFVKNIFTSGYDHSSGLFSGTNSYWNDLKETIVVKLLAVCNVFTLKSYFADIIFFNFLFFFGPVALYKIIMRLFKANNMWTMLIVFCIPSFLFWCSGLHKDGLIFSCICLIAYFFQKQLQAGRFSAKASLYILFAFILLFALRNFMAFLLVPALLTWYLCEKYGNRKPAIVFAVYGISLLLFFVSPYISNINFPDYVVEKQSEFKQIPGNSIIPVPALEPDAVSFLKFLPAAFDIAFLRPHISEVNNLAYIPAIGEIFLLWLLMALFLFRRGNTTIISSQSAFIIFCVSFSFSFLLLAGYTITFSGAIVRYRAVVLPLLFMPLAIWKFRKKYIVWGAAQ